jgi:hypothetical protein
MLNKLKRVFEDIGERVETEQVPKFYSETDKPKGKATIVEDEPLQDLFNEENND